MPKNKGFTLIEVLVALIIVGLGMLAVIRAVTQTVNNTDYLRQKTIAHWVAMNKLTEVRLANSKPSNDDSNGDVDMAGITWHWRMRVVSTDVASLQRIDIHVAPKDAGEKASIDSVSGFYSSAIAAGGSNVVWDVNPRAAPPNGEPNNGGSASSSSSSP